MLNELIAAASLAAASPLAPATLLPSGKWEVHYTETLCVLEHDYGNAQDPVILAIRPGLLNDTVEVRLSEPEPGYVARTDAGTLTLQPSGRSVAVKLSSYGPVTGNRRLTSFRSDQIDVAQMIMAERLVLERGHAGPPLSLAPTGSDKALAALVTCQDDLLKRWGIDGSAMRRLSRRPTPVGGSEAQWFKPRDYPKAALGHSRGGRAMVRVSIGATGLVEDCAVVQSAGNPDLDATTCRILRERGRYQPALDASGRATPAPKLVGVVWVAFGRQFRIVAPVAQGGAFRP